MQLVRQLLSDPLLAYHLFAAYDLSPPAERRQQQQPQVDAVAALCRGAGEAVAVVDRVEARLARRAVRLARVEPRAQVLKAIAGHTSLATTMQYYIVSSGVDEADAVARALSGIM